MKQKLALVKSSSRPSKPDAKGLLTDVRELILATRQAVAQAVNSALVRLYWQIGERIRTDILKAKRATYGGEILQTLSAKLAVEFGRGYSQRNLASMIRFAEVFPDARIVQALSDQLSWSHFTQIIYLEDPLKRDFYAEMCRIERWSTRGLARKIGGMLFERTALSKKPEKLEEFKPGDKGQMELYLRWLDRYERKAGEEAPIGLILCAGQRRETIELLDLEKAGIRVSSYWTDVLPKKELERKLHQAVLLARARLRAGTNRKIPL